jgi:hypothetical protein
MKRRSSILLFDMDGVLLEAGGYWRALQDCVSLVGKALGYREVRLSKEDIHLFEAVGITSEWDSSAVCASLLISQLWENGLDARLPENPILGALPPHSLPCPDFGTFCRAFASQPNQDHVPLLRAELLLMEGKAGYTPVQVSILQSILRKARSIQGSLTHRIFQEMVLGSQIFEVTYAIPPLLNVDAYLRQFDVPALAPSDLASLRTWLEMKDHSAAIFTNRPSQPPDGYFSTPEAEIGAKTVGLENIPIVGLGALSWCAFKHGLDQDAFLKPSPVHVLAALWLAMDHSPSSPKVVPFAANLKLSTQKEDSLVRALEVALQALEGAGRENWIGLEGSRVYVFEDTVRGMKSARAAGKVLAKMDIHPQVELCGITDSKPKQEALSDFGAAVFPSLSAALSSLGMITLR